MTDESLKDLEKDLARIKARYPERGELIDRVTAAATGNANDIRLACGELSRLCTTELAPLYREYGREPLDAIAKNLDWLSPLLGELQNTNWEGTSITQQQLADFALAGSLYNVQYAMQKMMGRGENAVGS